jgi:hypothetical protein
MPQISFIGHATSLSSTQEMNLMFFRVLIIISISKIVPSNDLLEEYLGKAEENIKKYGQSKNS